MPDIQFAPAASRPEDRYPVSVSTFGKVRAGQEQQALKAVEEDGLDNVVIRVGGDTYVAAGRGLSKDIQVGNNAYFDGKEGKVSFVNHRVNSAGSGVGAVVAFSNRNLEGVGDAGAAVARKGDAIIAGRPAGPVVSEIVGGALDVFAVLGTTFVSSVYVLASIPVSAVASGPAALYGMLQPTHAELLEATFER